MPHIPVLLDAVLTHIAEMPDEGWFVDCTFGRGGHTRAILNAKSRWHVLGLDVDIDAIQYGEREFAREIADGRLRLQHAEFSNVENWSQILPDEVQNTTATGLLGVLLDLGVSSPQLDEAHRGFSFYHDGPLDMRMNVSDGATAADIVNSWSEKELNDLFHFLGEVRSPFRVSRQIIERRREQKFSTTRELADLIAGAEGWRKKGHHPATSFFMALRIQVNHELDRLTSALPKIVERLGANGRFFVITFHSLEDRIVKNAFREFASKNLGKLVNKKVIQATWGETKDNPRARSAKLRIFEARGNTSDIIPKREGGKHGSATN